MPPLRNYYLFISHAWTSNAEYERLVDMLNKAQYFQWRNYSVPKTDPLQVNTERSLKRKINDQIQPTQAVLIVSGMYFYHREWIQYEIDKALEWKKPIIGIKPFGSQRIPREIAEVADAMVGWNTNSIVSAIRNHALRR